MGKTLLVALVTLGLATAGCAGLRGDSLPFRTVDLERDLDKDAVARYEAQWKQMRQAGHAEGATARLEYTNWWPLGLLGYWHRGSVTRELTPSGAPAYDVSRTRGFGPLAALYVSQTDVSFDAEGRRLGTAKMKTFLWGQLASLSEEDNLLPSGKRQRMSSLHLFHMHPINIHKMDHHAVVSLFSMPNPLGVDVPMRHGRADDAQVGHAGHGAATEE